MNPTAKGGRIFSFYRYSGTAANLLWTLGWATAAALAIQRWCSTRDSADSPNAFTALLPALFGCAMTVRAFSRAGAAEPLKNYPTESLGRRIEGWIAAIGWGTVAALWNLAVLSVLLRAAHDGNTTNILVMIPFSLIGWFLLIMLCVMITMTLDFLTETIHGTSCRSQNHLNLDGKYPPKS
jgi:hypothetical protein